MNKKEKDKEKGTKQKAESSISPEVHRKAEKIARAMMNTAREPKRKKDK